MAVLILGVGVGGALVIMSNGNGPSKGKTTTTNGSVATIPSDPQAVTKAAVIDAYKKSYEGFVAVGKERSPNLDDPRLTQYSTGAALIAKQRALADHKSKGQVYVGSMELHPTVIGLGSDTATVVDCTVDHTSLVDARTGSTVVDAGKGEGLAATAKLGLADGVWKVTDFKAENRSCVPPAA